MSEQLTYAQGLAVHNRGGKLLVSAAAGSGKTKVLVDRLLKYLTDPASPANIDEFLIITYTKAAASELRGKIASKLSEQIAQEPGNRHLQRQMQRLYLTKISTVHAFCADILREHAYQLDIGADFRVGDDNECLQLRNRAMEMTLEEAYGTLEGNPDFQAFVDTQGLGRNDSLVQDILEQVYDSAMCHLDPKAWCQGCVQAADSISEPLDTPWGSYLAKKLFSCLSGYIEALTLSADALRQLPGMEKPVQLLLDTVVQLQNLHSSTTWDEIHRRRNVDYGRLVIPKKFDDPSITEPVKAVRKACKETLEKKLRWFSDPASKVLEDMQQVSAASRGLVELVEKFEENYRRLKKTARVLDFTDLEHCMLDLLWGRKRTGITSVAKEIAQRFREIMVDEYQDSNGVQDAIFEALTQMQQNLFMVGDVKQSIYQFRLADPGIFLEKYSSFLDAELAQEGQGRKILLSSNFRSGGGVISGVNDVFFDCMSPEVGGLSYGEGEALQEGIPHIPIGEPEVELYGICVQSETYSEEAAFVAQRIRQLLDGTHFVRQADHLRPVVPEDIVILLRSPGSVGLEYQLALEQQGIPCAGSGGGDLLLTEEIGTLRSLLEVISNPRQDIPLVAVLASPVFGFSADDLAQLRSKHMYGSIYDALVSSDTAQAVDFLNTLELLRKGAAMRTLPELLALIFQQTRLDAVYGAMLDGELRQSNLQSFYQLVTDFSMVSSGGLDRLLEHLTALEDRGIPAPGEQPSGCVTIMSIHKSKGLEFPVVFLCGLSRRFNREDLRQQVFCHKSLGLGLSCVDRENRLRYPTLARNAISAAIASESVSEELRVLYVAMTRARDRLIMTYASQNLRKDIQDTVDQMELIPQSILTAEVSCPGDWVLYSALKRAEAGEFFALGGRPKQLRVSERPWKISVWESDEVTPADRCADERPLPQKTDLETVRPLLQYSYPHHMATLTPSKQTATQKKGRHKDQEVAENAGEQKPAYRTWRKPSFIQEQANAAAYGNAMHGAMQFIRFQNCSSAAAIEEEVARLVSEGFLTQQQGELINCQELTAFFTSDLGVRLRNASTVLREFKFTILDDGIQYGDGLEGEKVLLQGVVDCALVEEAGITVIDFKTDKVTEDTLPEVRQRYAQQVQTYAEALRRIFEKPILAKALYLFRLGEFLYL